MITAIALALQLATPPGPPHRGQSEWHSTWDSTGIETDRTVVLRSFSFKYLNDEKTSLLISQSVTLRTKQAIDGMDAFRLDLEAWANLRPDTGYHRLLWRRSFIGGREGQLLDKYYDVYTEACCAAWPAHTYLALATGTPVMTFTSDPLRLYAAGVATDQRERVVTYENTSSTLWSYGDKYPHAVGVLQIAAGDSVTSRVVLLAKDTDPTRRAITEQRYATPRLSVVTSTGRQLHGLATLNDGETASVVLTFDFDGVTSVLVPLRGDVFTTAGAILPPMATLRIVQ